jgi:hypothetical protein
MSRIPQNINSHGSLLDIQILINDYPDLLTNKIRPLIQISSNSIQWVSPLKNDQFAEYSDQDFLARLGMPPLGTPLASFWPNKGPHWDALGRVDNSEYFLVEAKAHLGEIISTPTKASSVKSFNHIANSLNSCKNYLKVNSKSDWAGTFYQYTNRLAHLYFLRVVNKQPAYLVFVYFVGDESVSGPRCVVEWKAALTVLEGALGIRSHKLKKYIADVFVDVRDIGL